MTSVANRFYEKNTLSDAHHDIEIHHISSGSRSDIPRTFNLASPLAVSLTYLLAVYYVEISPDILSGIFCNILSGTCFFVLIVNLAYFRPQHIF